MGSPTEQLSATVLDHAQQPRNYGAIRPCDGHARITGPCGDTMEFWIRVLGGRIVSIGFTTTGCGTSRAAGSMTTALALGKTLKEAEQIDEVDVEEALDALPAASRHCALLATDTLLAAMGDVLGHSILND